MNKEVKIQLYKENNLGLDGYLTLTKESDLPFSISIGDINDISKRTSTFSKSITVAGTKENNILLSHYYDVNVIDQTFNVNKLQKARVIIDGEVLYDNCLMQLIEINKIQKNSKQEESIEYIVQIKSQQSNFFDVIKNKELKDIKFSIKDIPGNDTPSFTYNPTYVLNSFDNTYTDGYKFIYQQSLDNQIGLNMFKPSIYVWNYWNKIIADAGYRYTFNEIGVTNSVLTEPLTDDINFRKLLIPFTESIKENSFKEQLFYKANIKSNDSSAPYKIVANPLLNNIKLDQELLDESSSYNTTTYKYTSKYSGFIEYDITSTYDIIFNNMNAFILKTLFLNASFYYNVKIKNTIYKNDILIDTVFGGEYNYTSGMTLNPGVTTLGNNTVSNKIKCVVAPNDVIRITSEFFIDTNAGALHFIVNGSNLQNTNFEQYLNLSNQTVNITSTVSNGSLNFGTILNMNDFIPNKIKQSDFIKSIFNMYNIYVVMDKYDSNLLHFYTRDKYYDLGLIKNWTSKLIKDKEQNIQFVSDDIKKRKTFNYKQDKDINNISYFDETKEIYGSTTFTFDNDYLSDEDKVELIFSPSPIILDGDKFYTNLSTESLRILYDGGSQDCNPYIIRGWGNSTNLTVSKYSMVTHFDNPLIPTFDLNFNVADFYHYQFNALTSNNLFNNYWRRTIHQLNTSKKLTAYFNLTESDITSLNLNDILYIQDSYWYINKIVDYNPIKTNITKVELISIDNLQKTAKGKIKPINGVGIKVPVVADIKDSVLGNTFQPGVIMPGGTKDITLGFDNIISSGTKTIGNGNTNTGSGATVIGNGNINTGTNSTVTGDNNTVESTSTVTGTKNIIKADATGSIISGTNNIIGSTTTAVGDNNIIPSGVIGTAVFGSNITASEQGTVYMDNIRVFEVLTLEPNSEIEIDTDTITFNNLVDVITPFKSIGIDAMNNLVTFNTTTIRGTGVNSILSYGSSGSATGQYSLSLGYNNLASEYGSVSLGTTNTASGFASFAVGDTNSAGGARSVALGRSNDASGYNAVALGRGNTTSLDYAIALGMNNNVSARSGVALGEDNLVNGAYGVSLGLYNQSTGPTAVALGSSNIASQYSMAIGQGNTTSNYHAVGIGFNNNVSGDKGVGIGNVNTVSGARSVALGEGNTVGGAYSVALGRNIVNNASESISIGGYNETYSNQSYILGRGSYVNSGCSGAVVLGRGIIGTAADTTFVDGLNIKTLTGGGSSINNLGIDSNGKVVIGSGGAGSNIIYDTYANINTMRVNSTLNPGKFYYITDRDIMLSAVKNNMLSLTGSRVLNIIKDSYYTPSTTTIGAITTHYGGIYGQTIARGSYPNGTLFTVNRYVIWGGQMWQRNTSGADTPGTSQQIIQSGWTLIPRSNTIFYEPKVFNVKYNFVTDTITEQSDDRGNIIKYTIGALYNYYDITDWGNINISNNKCNGIYNNFGNSYTRAYIFNNSNNGEIYQNSNSGDIFNNTNNGEIYQNSNSGDIFNNSNNGDILQNSNNGDIFNNTTLGIIYNNSNGGYIAYNSNTGEIYQNSNSGAIFNNSNNGIIYNNSNGGSIQYNSNLGEIANNSNKGYIAGNSNRGGITYNSSLSTGEFSIGANSNNGFIEYNRSNTTSNILIQTCMNNGNIGNIATPTNRTTTITQTQVNL